MNEIRTALSEAGCVVFRINVGKMPTPDGRWFDAGTPAGFSDLFGFRCDGRAFFIEVKTPSGRISQKQTAFLNAMRRSGALAGTARSVLEALTIIKGEEL